MSHSLLKIKPLNCLLYSFYTSNKKSIIFKLFKMRFELLLLPLLAGTMSVAQFVCGPCSGDCVSS